MIKKQISYKNGLYLVSTPIGNLQDISLRAIEILKKSKLILCENRLHCLKLLNKYDIKKKLISIHDYNEKEVFEKIFSDLNDSLVCLITDSGSPLISDPGYRLVNCCIKKNIYVTSIPGASAVIASLQLSGMPSNKFTFNGFIPKKLQQAKDLLISTKNNSETQIFFSSSHRLKQNIDLIQKIYGNRKMAVLKELTKINEEAVRTDVGDMLERINQKKFTVRGEFVIILSGDEGGGVAEINSDILKILSILLKKFSLTDAVRIVHKLTGLSKKELYERALSEKNNDP
ncbi:MAG: Ribosomal RNA small subunit methyltransferase I [Alphaproteobacteria bacterium MarineAlpha5_Bin11]|nr:16S rRNA (cytidine(1402)-2'-O)-methyltransferase [Pelagibacteraceae bacterium]PPR44846.1 MAG: Ribosomal RNA small subunit methyltransferase I [Alphaproteobacteria bacterium MarineAlpha5_Bin11]PPR51822.1 MAG: Ribosomal RNA small subunit methyltransferase I [Alphaproteobacteria bacterium MarineAlpha5_Bin10]|tara:strand:- start:567 stop:1427 length:861 start_codon:yes stop_codon:yes gene_type:complete